MDVFNAGFLDKARARSLRIKRLQAGNNQFGCGGLHHGDGSPDCPKNTHHHHDEYCILPDESEWLEAGYTGVGEITPRGPGGGHLVLQGNVWVNAPQGPSGGTGGNLTPWTDTGYIISVDPGSGTSAGWSKTTGKDEAKAFYLAKNYGAAGSPVADDGMACSKCGYSGTSLTEHLNAHAQWMETNAGAQGISGVPEIACGECGFTGPSATAHILAHQKMLKKMEQEAQTPEPNHPMSPAELKTLQQALTANTSAQQTWEKMATAAKHIESEVASFSKATKAAGKKLSEIALAQQAALGAKLNADGNITYTWSTEGLDQSIVNAVWGKQEDTVQLSKSELLSAWHGYTGEHSAEIEQAMESKSADGEAKTFIPCPYCYHGEKEIGHSGYHTPWPEVPKAKPSKLKKKPKLKGKSLDVAWWDEGTIIPPDEDY